MKAYLKRYPRILAFIGMIFFIITIPVASAEEVTDFVAKLKVHYQKTLPIKTYSLNYHFLNKQYRDNNYWDYQTPNRHMSVRMIEVDLEKRHFYDNDILYFSGGLLWDRVQFQNDTESYYYEKSGGFMGKGVIKQDLGNFDRFNRHNIMNIDFLAVRPLLEETNVQKNISLHYNNKSKTTTLTHKTSDDKIIDYEFGDNPLRLVSLNNRPQSGRFFYSDYQTTRGLTYARIVHKFYDGATEPNYVSYNDKFDIIDEVDSDKLKIPQGYGPELVRGDGIFTSNEIAPDLYLVTDSSARRNSLFKVNGDEIMVFGATGNTLRAEKTIKLIRDQFPNKTVASVFVAHPQGNQIAGLKPYVDQGIKILADEYTIAGIKAYPRFANDIERFKFHTINHEQIIDDSHFYVLENMHSKRQSFVYFKDSGIIFQADFLHVPFDNSITKVVPSYTKAFIDFVRSKQLKINRIVGKHRNNNISVEVMNKIYDAIL